MEGVSKKTFPTDTLAYYLLNYYGINDPSANFTLSPYEIKVMQGKVNASRTPKAFRRVVRNNKKS